MRRTARLVTTLLVLGFATSIPITAKAQDPSPATSTPMEVGQAMLAEPTQLTAAGDDAGSGAGDPVGYLARTGLGNFMPTDGTTFGILSTGAADGASAPNHEGDLSHVHGAEYSKLGGEDLVQLVLTMTVPAGANCLGFDFVFYSEEFPEFIDSNFNDHFVAELGESQLSIDPDDSTQIAAPRNFVLDPNGDFITVNNAFGVSAANSNGTTYDGATPLLRTQTPIGAITETVLILTILDKGDSIYDSSIFIDNIHFSTESPCTETTALQGGQKPQPCLGPTWYFAEGTTREGFDEYLLLFNPMTEAVQVTVRYLFADGSPPATTSVELGATSRTTIAVWEQSGVGRDRDLSLVVEARSVSSGEPAPIAAERAIYFDFATGRSDPDFPAAFNGSHTVRGEPIPFPDFFFGEGTTLPGFDQYITIQNPGPPQTVDVAYSKDDGSVVNVEVDLDANSRRTIAVFDPDEGVGRGVVGVSTRVTAREHGILAERPMYFSQSFADADGSNAIVANGGHVDFGNVPDDIWYLSEGNVLPNWFMFLTIYNPYTSANPTTIEYQLEGSPPITRTFTAPATSRTTIEVHNESDPLGVGRAVSDPVSRGVSVKVTTEDPAGVVVERPMYFNHPFPDVGVVDDGTNKAGSRVLKETFYFSEGTTRTDFDYFFTFQNPSTDTVSVALRYFLPDGTTVARSAELPPQSRTTVQLWSADQIDRGALGERETDFAAEIKASDEILVERPSYVSHAFPDIDYLSPSGLTNGGSVVFGLPDPCI